jgi:hypothetical protein
LYLGTVESVFHPIQTGKNILSLGGNLITRPVRTISGFKDQIDDCIETDTVKCLGKATALIGTTFILSKQFGNPTAKAGAVGEVAADVAGTVEQVTAEVAGNVEKVAAEVAGTVEQVGADAETMVETSGLATEQGFTEEAFSAAEQSAAVKVAAEDVAVPFDEVATSDISGAVDQRVAAREAATKADAALLAAKEAETLAEMNYKNTMSFATSGVLAAKRIAVVDANTAVDAAALNTAAAAEFYADQVIAEITEQFATKEAAAAQQATALNTVAAEQATAAEAAGVPLDEFIADQVATEQVAADRVFAEHVATEEIATDGAAEQVAAEQAAAAKPGLFSRVNTKIGTGLKLVGDGIGSGAGAIGAAMKNSGSSIRNAATLDNAALVTIGAAAAGIVASQGEITGHHVNQVRYESGRGGFF